MSTDTDPAAGVEQAAARLAAAFRDLQTCPPVRDLLPPGPGPGYTVQRRLTDAWEKDGRRPSGRKIGLTNPAVQRQLGVDQPDFGVLYADMAVPNEGTAPPGVLLQPRIEAEVAMMLGRDLTTGPFTADAVRSAVGEVVASLEIVDSRIAGWDITITDTVADNASCGLYVLGSAPVRLGDTDLRSVSMSLTSTSPQGATSEVSTGRGADCLGDPLAALAWLAQTVATLGKPLRAGEVVLSGALGPMVAVTPGNTYRATVSGLGAVSVTFPVERDVDQDPDTPGTRRS